MTALPKNLVKIRDELARQQGDNHANPIIRSMYPSRSRGQMSGEFEQLYSLGFTAGALEVMKMAENLAVALEMMEAGYAGMFGHQGASPEVDCWERGQQIVSNALKEFREWRGGGRSEKAESHTIV